MPLRLVTWNIQWGRGCDGRVDFPRIVRTAREMGDFDVLCVQEVARNFPGLPGSNGEDQFRLLAELLPGYAAIEGIGTDIRALDGEPVSNEQRPAERGAGIRLRDANVRESGAARSSAGAASVSGVTSPKGAPVSSPSDGARRQFGNMILTRLPVLQAFRHLLPWPADPAVPAMQRVAVETVLQTASGPLRVTTTHLEYYSVKQRAAQVEQLRELQAQAAAHAHDVDHSRKEGGPFQNAARPASGILTADFNFRPDDPLYARLQAPFSDGTPRYLDSWQVHHPGRPHAPTLGVFDREQWPEASTCDFIFVTEDLADRVREVRVNGDTDASDHQPVLLVLN